MKLYVGNLSYKCTAEDLREVCSQYGEVSDVTVITDRETGRSRGFAFVEMPNADEGQSCIENLNDQPVQGRNVKVNEARPKQFKPRFGGGGGGNRGGGGGYNRDSGGY